MEAMFFSSVWVVLLIVVGADAQTNSIKDYCKRCVLDVQQCNCSIRYDHLNITCNDDGQDFPKLFNDSQDTCKNFDGLDNATVSIYIACPISKIPARCLNLNGEKLRRFSLFITSEWNLQNIDSSAFAEIKGLTALTIADSDSIAEFPLVPLINTVYKCDPELESVSFGLIGFNALQMIEPGAISKLWQHTNCSRISVNLNFCNLTHISAGEFSNTSFYNLDLRNNILKSIDPMGFTESSVWNNLHLTLHMRTAYDTNPIPKLTMEGTNSTLSVSIEGLTYEGYENTNKFQCFPNKGSPNLCAVGLKRLEFVEDQDMALQRYPFCYDLLTNLQCHNKKISSVHIDLSHVFNEAHANIFNPGKQYISTEIENVSITTPQDDAFCMDFSGWHATKSFKFTAPTKLSPWKICEPVLRVIISQAEHLSFNGYDFGNTFPLVVLKMQNLKIFDISGSYLNCSCGLSRETKEFMQKVTLTVTGFCYDEIGQPLEIYQWVVNNYDRCNDTRERLKNFASPACEDYCDILPHHRPWWNYFLVGLSFVAVSISLSLYHIYMRRPVIIKRNQRKAVLVEHRAELLELMESGPITRSLFSGDVISYDKLQKILDNPKCTDADKRLKLLIWLESHCGNNDVWFAFLHGLIQTNQRELAQRLASESRSILPNDDPAEREVINQDNSHNEGENGRDPVDPDVVSETEPIIQRRASYGSTNT